MYVEDFINPDIPVLGKDNSVEEALRLMDNTQLNVLPVVYENQLLAFLPEDTLLNYDDSAAPLTQVYQHLLPSVVEAKAHPYEAAARMVELKMDAIPVIDESGKYLGVVTQKDLFIGFFENSGISRPGGIITLEVKPIDYSLSEIVRICESCEATVLSTETFFEPGNEWMTVVVKTNRRDLQSIKATFERFEYTIKDVFGVLPKQDDLKERYRLLMNYINM